MTDPKITDYDTLLQKMIDLEFESVMDDRNEIIDIVYNTVMSRVENMDPDELMELAEYHGIDVDLEDK